MATIKFITEPLQQYVTRTKTKDMVYARTTYTCPLCKVSVSNREFLKHVNTTHALRKDECFAMLYGVPYPARCTCGKELHYSESHHGYPKTCGNCATGCTSKLNYKNAEDAHKHIEQLEAMLAQAKKEEKHLKQEAELSRIPLADLPYPTKKDARFLKRLAMSIRTYAVNCEKEKLQELANIIDAKVASL